MSGNKGLTFKAITFTLGTYGIPPPPLAGFEKGGLKGLEPSAVMVRQAPLLV